MKKISDGKRRRILADLRAFFSDEWTRDSRLARAYEASNLRRSGRQGRFQKGPFALYWLVNELGDAKLAGEFLDDVTAISKEITKAAERIDSIRKRYRRRGIVELFDISPEMTSRLKKAKQMRALEKTPPGLPTSVVLDALRQLDAIPPADISRFKREFKEIKKAGALADRIFRFLYEEKKAGRNVASQRNLARRFTARIGDLTPYLEGMAFDRIIIWDKKGKTISLNGYDPGDRRRFTWLAASSWPSSPFEPHLEKGKSYPAKNFRGYVVEEWVKTGAAKFSK